MPSPPEPGLRKNDKSTLAIAGFFDRFSQKLGTPRTCVGLCFRISLSNSFGLNLGISIVFIPKDNGMCIEEHIPYAAKGGIISKKVCFLDKAISPFLYWKTIEFMLSSVSIIPFGFPVVPDV